MNIAILREPSEFSKEYYCYADGCGYIENKEFRIHRHFFDNYLIMAVTKGTLVVIQYGNTYYIKENEYIVMDLHHPHEYFFAPETDSGFFWSHCYGKILDILFQQLTDLTSLPIVRRNPLMIPQLEAIIDSARIFDEHQVSAKLYTSYMLVLNDIQNPLSSASEMEEWKQFKIKVDTYISTHMQEPILLDDFAEEMNLSKYYFIKKFKKLLNKTPMEYILDEKLKVASYYLLNTDDKLENIAHMVGFSDVTYFLKVFKKKMEVTPKQYKRFYSI